VTPAARVAAAIGLLDAVLAGAAAEKALTTWARRNRYAGAGDRAAIRDLVFDALRCRRSHAWLGGAETGRGLMLGALRAQGRDPAEIFTGDRYAPAPPGPDEVPGRSLTDASFAIRHDVPDWLLPALRDSLGADLAPILDLLRRRAPVFLRCNLAKGPRAAIAARLAAEGIETAPHPLSPSALQVTENARRVQRSAAYAEGLVEMQDAASQAVADLLPLAPGDRVLDYCAGGGGKALALAARMSVDAPVHITAHDADPGRMRDLPARAARAGVRIAQAASADLADQRFDLVLCDAPCSGSGAWRRSPEAKWRLTPDRLAALHRTQDAILDRAADLVAPSGALAYATCSLLNTENRDRVAAFLARHSGWRLVEDRRLTPLDGADGFYVARLARA